MSTKVVLISGGTRGIGAAMVTQFQALGWTVAATASSEGSRWECTPELKLICDVRVPAQIRTAVKTTLATFGRIDALINNAGTAGSNPLESGTPDDLWNEIIDVNLHGTYHFCKAVMPILPDQTGRIINIGSVLSHKGVPDASAYVTAKHAVLGLTRSLAHYLAPRQVTVNIICPGWTETDMARERMGEIGITVEQLKKGVPLGRFVNPKEVADLAAYLASPSASAITGQSFVIDGGVLA